LIQIPGALWPSLGSMVARGPEKAGVGGSIPSLATISHLIQIPGALWPSLGSVVARGTEEALAPAVQSRLWPPFLTGFRFQARSGRASAQWSLAVRPQDVLVGQRKSCMIFSRNELLRGVISTKTTPHGLSGITFLVKMTWM